MRTPILAIEEKPDGSLLITPEAMEVGTFFTTRLAGETMMVRKNEDGSIDFFALVKRRLPWRRWMR